MSLPDTVNSEQGRAPIVNRDRDRARNAILAAEKGHSQTMCAQAAGIARRTLYYWLDKGKQIRQLKEDAPHLLPLTPYDKDYTWFLRAFEKAEIKRKEELLSRIDKAGEKSWQPNAWLLERLHPDEFSTRAHVQVTGSAGNEEKTFTLYMGTTEVKEDPDIEEADYEVIENAS